SSELLPLAQRVGDVVNRKPLRPSSANEMHALETHTSAYALQRALAEAGVANRVPPVAAGVQFPVRTAADAPDGASPHAAPPPAVSERRHERRTSAQMSASLWSESKRQSFSCTVRDRSPGGAKLEFSSGSYGDGLAELMIGDKLVLTFNTAQESTS